MGMSESDIASMLRSDMFRILAAESGADSKAIRVAAEAGALEPSVLAKLSWQVNFFINGKIIGGTAFLLDTGTAFYGHKRAAAKQLGRPGFVDNLALFAYARLRKPPD